MHGGDIYRNKVKYDFSVNVNPLGIPDGVKTAMFESVESMDTYPDIEYDKLKSAIAFKFGVDTSAIVCGNGASELIMAIFQGLKPEKVLLVAPGFSGYEKAAHAVDAGIEYFYLKKEDDFFFDVEEYIDKIRLTSPDMIVLTNPNNPNGGAILRQDVKKIAEYCQKKGIAMVIDECFSLISAMSSKITFLQDASLFNNVIILSAFTKSFAIPGVRLGVMVCSDIHVCAFVKKMLPEWNVSVLASNAGYAACKEVKYITESRKYIEEEKEFLTQELTKLGIKVYPSMANYLLLETDIKLKELLLEHGILIRDCSDYEGLGEGFYRIAIRTRKENEILVKTLAGEKIEEEKKTEYVLPQDIENRSFEIIAEELRTRGIVLPENEEAVTKRVIHTSADFDYAKTLKYSKNAVETARELIRNGAVIVTDTNMAKAGINKTSLSKFGGEVYCFMADEDVAREAKEREVTRATVSMERAAKIDKPVIFAIGNAPTALIALKELMDNTDFKPAFVIGVPVGFVNVEASKELILNSDVPYIVNKGRKGGSNVAAAICNAIMYGIDGAR